MEPEKNTTASMPADDQATVALVEAIKRDPGAAIYVKGYMPKWAVEPTLKETILALAERVEDAEHDKRNAQQAYITEADNVKALETKVEELEKRARILEHLKDGYQKRWGDVSKQRTELQERLANLEQENAELKVKSRNG